MISPTSSRASDTTLAMATPPEDLYKSSLVSFDGPDDPENPQNWSFGSKMYQSLLLAHSVLLVTFAAGVFSPSAEQLSEEFGISVEVANLSTALYLLGYAIGPVLWGPASEYHGRYWPMIISFAGFTVFAIPVAVAQNVQTIMICRFMASFFGSGPLNNVAGSYVDMWPGPQRGAALTMFSISAMGGPSLGPLVGSFIVESYLGWRWTEWVTLIWSAAVLVLLVFTLKESYPPRLHQLKATRLRYETKRWDYHSTLDETPFSLSNVVHVYLMRPFTMLFREPILLIVTCYISYVYDAVAIPYVYGDLRGWKTGESGLPFLAILLGSALACLIHMAFVSRYNRICKERGAAVAPDERCIPLAVGSVVYPIGWLIFALTAPQYDSSGAGEMVALVLIGMGLVLTFLNGLNLLIDVYLSLTNSAMAANTIVRSAAAAAFPLFTVQMFSGLGVLWAGLLLFFVALVALPFPFAFRHYMDALLHKSKYAPKIPGVRGSKPGDVEAAESKAPDQSREKQKPYVAIAAPPAEVQAE